MNIKKLVPVGILAVLIAGGIGAYMFLYPKEVKVRHAVVVPKAHPRVVAPVAKPPVAAPVSAPVATPVVAASGQALQPPLKLSKSIKTADKRSKRSKSADLRDCLKLQTNEDIAKCAGE